MSHVDNTLVLGRTLKEHDENIDQVLVTEEIWSQTEPEKVWILEEPS